MYLNDKLGYKLADLDGLTLTFDVFKYGWMGKKYLFNKININIWCI